ncbi:MAG: hypothetical protein V7K57_08530 [Nostoc sp.]|uniref:hypothetical protein n=1 Tax=Nostoc sp. TaxID=1180 RepID=UPI002FF987AB
MHSAICIENQAFRSILRKLFNLVNQFCFLKRSQKTVKYLNFQLYVQQNCWQVFNNYFIILSNFISDR